MRNSELVSRGHAGGAGPVVEAPSRVFTEYVRSLGPGGEPPDAGDFDRLWQALRTALRSEIRKRGLWDSPPSYLGVYGAQSWEAEPGEPGALDELLAACYTFNFIDRLRALRAQLKVKPNIDGLVFRNLRNFLHERQRQYDPLGFRLFELLSSAARQAVSAGEASVFSGDPRVRNGTVLALGSAASPRAQPVPDAPPPELGDRVSAWCSDLLPELITARGRRQEEVVEALRRRLIELPSGSPEVVDFKELLDLMKAEVRARWAALFEQSAGAVGTEPDDPALARVVQLYQPEAAPGARLEARQLFHKLTACVAETLERMVIKERTRRYLSDLWQLLRLHATEPGEAGEQPPLAAEAQADKLPSQRRIAELLEIPRDRLPELTSTLGEILQRCRTAISGKTTVTSLKERRPRAPGKEGSDAR